MRSLSREQVMRNMKQYAVRWMAGLAGGLLVGCTGLPTQPMIDQTPALFTTAAMDAFCAANSCRGDTHISLATVEGEYRYQNDYFWPLVQDKIIRVLPGERVFVETQMNENGAFVNFTQVENIRHPDRTFEVYFRQVPGNYGMQVTIRNPFEFPIDLNLARMNTQGDIHVAGSCPIRAERTFLEQWAQPAKTLIIYDIRRLEANAPIICRG